MLLLLLLSLNVHYDLLNCEDIVSAKFNDALPVDHDRQNLILVHTLLDDLEQKTRKLSVLIANDDLHDPRKEKPIVLKSLLSRKHQKIPHPKTSTKSSENLAYPEFDLQNFAAIGLAILDPNVTSRAVPDHNSKPKLLEDPLSILSVKDQSLYTPSLVHSGSHKKPRHSKHQVTFMPRSIKKTTLGPNAKNWFREIAPYTRLKKKLRKASRDQQQPYWSDTGSVAGTTVPMSPRTAGTSGFSNFTTAGDVLFGKIKVEKPRLTPVQRYYYLMKVLDEGYLVVFAIELFRLIAMKEKAVVREALAPMKSVFQRSLENHKNIGFYNPFLVYFGNLTNMMTENGVDELRTYSSVMTHALLNRRQVLSPGVNSIIDRVSGSYTDEDGKCLLSSLMQFENYPNSTNTRFTICEKLFEAIFQPLRRPVNLNTQELLLIAFNKTLEENFSQPLKYRTVATLDWIGMTTSRISIRPGMENKRETNNDHKRKGHIEREFYYIYETSRHKSQEYIEAITTKRQRDIRKKTTPAFLWKNHTKRIIVPRKLVKTSASTTRS